jgi:hypothetical protein
MVFPLGRPAVPPLRPAGCGLPHRSPFHHTEDMASWHCGGQPEPPWIRSIQLQGKKLQGVFQTVSPPPFTSGMCSPLQFLARLEAELEEIQEAWELCLMGEKCPNLYKSFFPRPLVGEPSRPALQDWQCSGWLDLGAPMWRRLRWQLPTQNHGLAPGCCRGPETAS